jgi:hypothetical protein
MIITSNCEIFPKSNLVYKQTDATILFIFTVSYDHILDS